MDHHGQFKSAGEDASKFNQIEAVKIDKEGIE